VTGQQECGVDVRVAGWTTEISNDGAQGDVVVEAALEFPVGVPCGNRRGDEIRIGERDDGEVANESCVLKRTDETVGRNGRSFTRSDLRGMGGVCRPS